MMTEKTNASVVKTSTPSNSHSDPIVNTAKKKKRRRQKKKNSLVSASTSTSGKKRNRSQKGSGSNNGAHSPLVHLPHAKITLRHIRDVEKHGNYSKMIDLIRKVVTDFNAASTGSNNALSVDRGGETFVLPEELSSIPITLEKSSIDRLLLIEKSVNMKEAEKDIEGIEEQETGELGIVPNEQEQKSTLKKENELPVMMPPSDIKVSVKQDAPEIMDGKNASTEATPDSNGPVGGEEERKKTDKEVYKNEISARVLYIVPPRKSRRRGVITGHAYVVLHPPMPRFIVEKAKTHEEKIVADLGMKNTSSATNAIGGNFITAADRTKALAQSRLILRQVIANLAEACNSDSGKEVYCGMKVEQSPSQKIWKVDALPSCNASGKKGHGYSGHYHAKYDSTIEQSEDFQAFLEKRTKIEEEIANRPKPPPGGGTTEATVAVDGAETAGKSTEDSKSSRSATIQETMENGQPIPALVLHLRQKKAAAQKSKSSKSTSSSVADSKSKKSSSGAGKGKGSSSSGRGTSEKKGGKGGGKKNTGGSSKSEGGSKKGQSLSNGSKKKGSEKSSKKSYVNGSKKQNGSQTHSGKYKTGEKKLSSIAPAKILMKPAGSGGSNVKK